MLVDDDDITDEAVELDEHNEKNDEIDLLLHNLIACDEVDDDIDENDILDELVAETERLEDDEIDIRQALLDIARTSLDDEVVLGISEDVRECEVIDDEIDELIVKQRPLHLLVEVDEGDDGLEIGEKVGENPELDECW